MNKVKNEFQILILRHFQGEKAEDKQNVHVHCSFSRLDHL